MHTVLRVILASALLSFTAAAQEEDAGVFDPLVEPVAAEADAVEPPVVIRDAQLDEPAAEAPSVAQEPEVEPPSPEEWAFSANLQASFRVSFGGSTLFPYDSDGTTHAVNPFTTRVRVTPELRYGRIGLIAEADAATGAIFGTPPDSLVSDRQPFPAITPVELRKLYLEYRWSFGALRVGQQTSNWGLGLLANDGATDAEPGEFGQKHFGNLTWRALLALRPFYGLGGSWRAIETIVAGDLISRDNFGELAKGDRAFQAVFAMRFVKDADNHVGFYGVYRNQTNVNVTDGGKATEVVVLDFAGKWQLYKEEDRELRIGFEVVGISGTTTQARNENSELLNVAQLGAAVKLRYRTGPWSVFFDGGYASGDHNPADDSINNMRFDRDYKVGLILFDQVMAYQTGRSSVRASDPSIVGVPPEGADLVGTGGSITGAWYLFPRLMLTPADWFNLYAGPLFAFASARPTDPYNTRLNGGVSTNSLGGQGGLFLGTEADVGVQFHYAPMPELKLTVTGEGGLFVPGNAYFYSDGRIMNPVGFGRVRLTVAFN